MDKIYICTRDELRVVPRKLQNQFIMDADWYSVTYDAPDEKGFWGHRHRIEFLTNWSSHNGSELAHDFVEKYFLEYMSKRNKKVTIYNVCKE